MDGPGVKFCVSDFRQKSRMALESRADSGLNGVNAGLAAVAY